MKIFSIINKIPHIILVCTFILITSGLSGAVPCDETPEGQQNCPLGVHVDNQNPDRANKPLIGYENVPAGPGTATYTIPTPTPGSMEVVDDRSGPVAGIENWVIRWLSTDSARYIVLPLQKVFSFITDIYPVRWYGAACNGSASGGSDDSDELIAAYNALPGQGGTILLCPKMKIGGTDTGHTGQITFTKSTYLRMAQDNASTITDGLTLDAPLIWQGAAGGIIGNGSSSYGGSRVIWNGNADPTDHIAVLQGRGVSGMNFRGFSLVAPYGKPYQAGILFASIQGGAISLNNTVDDVWFRGNTTEVMRGIRLTGGVCIGGTHSNMRCTADAAGVTFCDAGTNPGVCTKDANNSENHFMHVHCSNISGPCISVENSQSYGNAAYNLITGGANAPASYPDPHQGGTPWWTECNVAIGGIGGACVTGDTARRGAFCLNASDCTDNVNGAICSGGTEDGEICNTDALTAACYTGGGTCSVPGYCNGGTGNGNACGATCTSGGGTCLMGCARTATGGGSLSMDVGLMGGAQRGVICGRPDQPSVFQNIDSESAAAMVYTGNNGGTNGGGLILDSWRLAGNRWGPARVCKDGTDSGEACTDDSTCNGGFCGGCTDARRVVIAKMRCVGGSLGAGSAVITCTPGGNECTASGSTCVESTTTRPCCTAEGTGPECLEVVHYGNGPSLEITNSIIGSDAADSGFAPQGYKMTYTPGSGQWGFVRLSNSRFQSSEADPFIPGDKTHQFFEIDNVLIRSGTATTHIPFANRITAPTWFGVDYRQRLKLDLAGFPTPAIPTPFILRPSIQKCISMENLNANDDNYEWWTAPGAGIVSDVSCQCVSGDCDPAATIELANRAGTVMTHATVTCETTTPTTLVPVTAANALTAGDGLKFNVTNTPGVDPNNRYLICIDYYYW